MKAGSAWVLVLGTVFAASAGQVDAAASEPATRPAVRIDADFPGGNIIVDRIEGDRVFLRPDRRDTPRWWFYWYFRVRGAAGRTLSFTFTDGEPIGVRGPAVSTDGGKTWAWQGTESASKVSFSYAFGPAANDVRFCFTVPYLESNLRAFLEDIKGNEHLRQTTLCKTRKGRDLEALYMGRLDGRCVHRVLLTARHHACETMANYALEGVIRAVLEDEKEGWLRDNVEFLIVPFVDKDGVEDGDQGKCRSPHDPYRDYAGESIYPAVRGLRELVPRWADGRLRVVLDLHCPSIRGGRSETVFFVEENDPRLQRNLDRFSTILESLPPAGLPYRASDNLPYGLEWNTSENLGEGRSLTEWAGGIPGVEVSSTLEIAYANALGTAVTADSARLFGRDLARAIQVYLQQRAISGGTQTEPSDDP
jgi:hypothetical protein